MTRSGHCASNTSLLRPLLLGNGTPLQYRQDIQRIGPVPIIEAGIGEGDHTVSPDHIGRRNRQRPFTGRSVLGWDIELEAVIGRAQLVGEGVDQAESLADLLSDVAQDRECQGILFDRVRCC